MLQEYITARRKKRIEKSPAGTLRLFVTIPVELADIAIELYSEGYNQNDWVKEGIRTLKRRQDAIKT